MGMVAKRSGRKLDGNEKGETAGLDGSGNS